MDSTRRSRSSLARRPPLADHALPEPTSVQASTALEHLLSRETCQQFALELPRTNRNRTLTIDVMMLALVALVTRQLPSLLELTDRLRNGLVAGLSPIGISTQALYARFKALPHAQFVRFLQLVTHQLNQQHSCERTWLRALAPFATGIYAIDDTTLDALLRKTEVLQRFKKGSPETLGGRLGCLIDLSTGRLAQVMHDTDAAANEKTHIRPLLKQQPRGGLYVFDLGYFCFPLFDHFTDIGAYFVTRWRQGASFVPIQTLASGPLYRDRIVWMGRYRADRAAHPVRLVELLVDGSWLAYVTNVLDPKLLPAPNLWVLYAQRWSIEMIFAAVKRALGLAFLRVTHRNGILLQVWSTLIVYQVLQTLRLEIAVANGWNEDHVSWTNLMRRIGWYVERPDPTRSLFDWLVQEAKQLQLGKRGVRKRRRTVLPGELLTACSRVDALDTSQLPPPRKARQGDRKKANARGVIYVAPLHHEGLSASSA